MSQQSQMTQSNDVADVTPDLRKRTAAQQVTNTRDDLQEKVAKRQPAGTGTDRPERRRSLRGRVHGEPPRADLVALIVGSYAEMPGLSLHPHQAARLFGLREATCLVVLSDLVKAGQLRRSSDGQYRAANSAAV